MDGYATVAAFLDCFDAPEKPPALAAVYRDTAVVRLATPTVWEAVAAAVVRQVIRADQARILYQRLLDARGAFPAPGEVLRLGESHFRTLGMGFKAKTLVRVAQAFADDRFSEELSAEALLSELQHTPGVGPWTARVACSDHLNAWDVYPMSDLAVRTWASRLTTVAWPTGPDEFERRWRSRTAPHTAAATAHLLSRAQAAI